MELNPGNGTTIAQPFVRRGERFSNENIQVGIQQTQLPDGRGLLAVELIARWGMVNGKPTTEEDTAGRAKMDLMEPTEVVERAFTMACLAWAQLEEMEWLVKVPTYQEAETMIQEHDNQDEKNRRSKDVAKRFGEARKTLKELEDKSDE